MTQATREEDEKFEIVWEDFVNNKYFIYYDRLEERGIILDTDSLCDYYESQRFDRYGYLWDTIVRIERNLERQLDPDNPEDIDLLVKHFQEITITQKRYAAAFYCSDIKPKHYPNYAYNSLAYRQSLEVCEYFFLAGDKLSFYGYTNYPSIQAAEKAVEAAGLGMYADKLLVITIEKAHIAVEVFKRRHDQLIVTADSESAKINTRLAIWDKPSICFPWKRPRFTAEFRKLLIGAIMRDIDFDPIKIYTKNSEMFFSLSKTEDNYTLHFHSSYISFEYLVDKVTQSAFGTTDLSKIKFDEDKQDARDKESILTDMRQDILALGRKQTPEELFWDMTRVITFDKWSDRATEKDGKKMLPHEEAKQDVLKIETEFNCMLASAYQDINQQAEVLTSGILRYFAF